jgi:hypothetical protein
LQFSALIHAANIGFMIMFSAVVAPAVFSALSQKAAGAYLRVLFPRMFIFGFLTSTIAAIASVFESNLDIATISSGIAVGFLINAFVITPKINKHRDKVLNGDLAAKTIFKRLHLTSVCLFFCSTISQFLCNFHLNKSALNKKIMPQRF